MSKKAVAARWLLPLGLLGMATGATLALSPMPFEPWQQLGLAGFAILTLPALDALGRRAGAALQRRGQARRVVIRINRRR